MENLTIIEANRKPIEDHRIELVERKGFGHPDTLADGIAESVSKSLSRFYLDEFGRILHHNTDQVEVVGGKVNVEFGGGEVVKPIRIILSGRATTEASGKELPVHDIAIESSKDFIKEKLGSVSINKNFTWTSEIGHGSVDLTNLYKENQMPKSNDTSFGVGYAPFSNTETLVHEVDRYMNSKKFKKKFPEIGEDVKVMAYRNEDVVKITIAGAFISERVPDLDHYISVKEDFIRHINKFAEKKSKYDVEISMNTADDYENEVVYLTLTGTSAEAGDDGSVGRGNRTNGLITPCRPMSLEAPAGKNPLAHVGKVYNVLSKIMANDIYEKTEAEEVFVKLLSQIGKPINEPQVADVEVICDGNLSDIRYEAKKIAADRLKNIRDITDMILNDHLYVY